MPAQENWKTYRAINNLYRSGKTFSEIATEYNDSTEHIEDFWTRFNTFKREQKRKWDKENHDKNLEKQREYYKNNHEKRLEYQREYVKKYPDYWKKRYARRKELAELNGTKLYDKKYQDAYRSSHRSELAEKQLARYYKDLEKSRKCARENYIRNRDNILQYHKELYLKNRTTVINDMIQRGLLPYGCDTSGSPSSYELLVKNFLDLNNIKFTREKTFDGCCDKRLLRFDFYLDDYNILIEVDGEQHFMPDNCIGRTCDERLDMFMSTIMHDQIKDDFCANNGIPLLRIPYWRFSNDNWKSYILLAIKAYRQIAS